MSRDILRAELEAAREAVLRHQQVERDLRSRLATEQATCTALRLEIQRLRSASENNVSTERLTK